MSQPQRQDRPPSIPARAKRKLRAIYTNIRARLRETAFPIKVRRLSGLGHIAASPDEFIVVCLVRNGAIYLPEFLRHYREMGAKHIVLLDNGSTDGTPALVADEPNVTVMRTIAPYKIYKDIMKRWLVTRFGRLNWVLCVDIDELFDYPFRNEISAPALLRYLNRKGFTAVAAQMLDLFPQGAISKTEKGNWRRSHRFYSLADLEKEPYTAFYGNQNQVPSARLEVMHGGIRRSAFQVRALLTKHPLLFPSQGLVYLHAHHISGARIADLSAVLLHYKYVGDFEHYVRTIVNEESFSMESREYKRYLRVLEENSALTLYSESAHEFLTVERLVEQGLLVVSDNFRNAASLNFES